MVERRASLMEPRLEHLLERVDSKFTLVTLSATRARQINDYYNQLGEGLGRTIPPQVTSVSRKPLSIALEEIEVGKIEGRRREVVPEGTGDGEVGEVAEGALVADDDTEVAEADASSAADGEDAGETA